MQWPQCRNGPKLKPYESPPFIKFPQRYLSSSNKLSLSLLPWRKQNLSSLGEIKSLREIRSKSHCNFLIYLNQLETALLCWFCLHPCMRHSPFSGPFLPREVVPGNCTIGGPLLAGFSLGSANERHWQTGGWEERLEYFFQLSPCFGTHFRQWLFAETTVDFYLAAPSPQFSLMGLR